MKNMINREQLKNQLTFVGALLFSLCAAEVVLRIMTPFPINYSSNKEPDPDLGYRVSKDFHEADTNGFRNLPGTSYEIMAIGDSHTYGNNVSSSDSWPAILARDINNGVYNFGVGSYGIFAYHAILKTHQKPETRSAIVALYPRNDFEISGSNCLILNNMSAFWQNEFDRLQLIRPEFEVSSACSERLQARSLSVGDWLERNTAIFGALDAMLDQKGLSKEEARYEFPDKIQAISAVRVGQSHKSMDSGNTALRDMLKNFRLMASDWRRSETGVGVLIIPSRESVIYGYFAHYGRLGELDPQFVTQMQNQIALENECARILSEEGVPYRSALPEVIAALEKGLKENRNFYRPDDDGHPLQDGYAAYAAAAKKLLGQIQAR